MIKIPPKVYAKAGGVITAQGPGPGLGVFWELKSVYVPTGALGIPIGSLKWDHTKTDRCGLAVNFYYGPEGQVWHTVVDENIPLVNPMQMGASGTFAHAPVKPGSITLDVYPEAGGLLIYHDDGVGGLILEGEELPSGTIAYYDPETGSASFFILSDGLQGYALADYQYSHELVDPLADLSDWRDRVFVKWGTQ